MKHYIEITLIDNSDINLFSLWSKVFQQIHLGLVEMQDDQGNVPIGVAFPEYMQGDKYSILGSKLRLFAEHDTMLDQFNVSHWLARLSDYVHCTGIRTVPEKLSGYATYQREQPKASKERQARRYAKYHNVDYEDALSRYNQNSPKRLTTPFIRLQSLSGGQTFYVWIKKTVVTESSEVAFSRYGLSATSAVPEF